MEDTITKLVNPYNNGIGKDQLLLEIAKQLFFGYKLESAELTDKLYQYLVENVKERDSELLKFSILNHLVHDYPKVRSTRILTAIVDRLLIPPTPTIQVAKQILKLLNACYCDGINSQSEHVSEYLTILMHFTLIYPDDLDKLPVIFDAMVALWKCSGEMHKSCILVILNRCIRTGNDEKAIKVLKDCITVNAYNYNQVQFPSSDMNVIIDSLICETVLTLLNSNNSDVKALVYFIIEAVTTSWKGAMLLSDVNLLRNVLQPIFTAQKDDYYWRRCLTIVYRLAAHKINIDALNYLLPFIWESATDITTEPAFAIRCSYSAVCIFQEAPAEQKIQFVKDGALLYIQNWTEKYRSKEPIVTEFTKGFQSLHEEVKKVLLCNGSLTDTSDRLWSESSGVSFRSVANYFAISKVVQNANLPLQCKFLQEGRLLDLHIMLNENTEEGQSFDYKPEMKKAFECLHNTLLQVLQHLKNVY